MFFIDDNGTEVHSTCSHDYSAEAEQRIEAGEDYSDVAEELTERFKRDISALHDREEDVGAVVEYFKTKLGQQTLVAYFDYENFVGTILGQ